MRALFVVLLMMLAPNIGMGVVEASTSANGNSCSQPDPRGASATVGTTGNALDLTGYCLDTTARVCLSLPSGVCIAEAEFISRGDRLLTITIPAGVADGEFRFLLLNGGGAGGMCCSFTFRTIHSIAIFGPATLAAGASADYEIEGRDAHGAGVGLALASIAVTAPTVPGVIEVSYAQAGIRGTMQINVVPAEAASIRVTGAPMASAHLPTLVNAEVFDRFGNPTTDQRVNFSVTGGEIDAAGRFTPAGEGLYTVRATQGLVTAAIEVNVIEAVSMTVDVRRRAGLPPEGLGRPEVFVTVSNLDGTRVSGVPLAVEASPALAPALACRMEGTSDYSGEWSGRLPQRCRGTVEHEIAVRAEVHGYSTWTRARY